ncbi:MAG: Gfo/Idh/MocA family oxidoreductase [Clostridiales bacterium]|jgi:predicted dehydrogenase|nr:Gfo/Idh/MocA family oxidoreductase [Clostridiales bacterium]
MGKKIRIGVIGTGGISHLHMRPYQSFDDVEVVGACDIVPGKARAFLDQYGLTGAPAFESAAEFVKSVELDGVSICTYNTTHAECTIAALEAGVHVLCEKPMSFTLQQAVDMLRAQRRAGKILTIGFQPRYGYMRRKVDEMIDSGAIGKVYYVQSGGGRRRGIPGGTFISKQNAGYGCLGDIGCYSIDECLHAIHYPKPLTVSAIATNHFGTNPKYWKDAEHFEVDDFSVALVRMEGGVTFVFKQAWAMHANSLGNTLWLGTDGGIEVRNGFDEHNHPSSVILYTDVNGMQVDSQVLPSVGFNAYGYPKDQDNFAAKIRGFVDAVKTGGPDPIPGAEIIRNQAICDGIYRSSMLGKEVEIEIPEI